MFNGPVFNNEVVQANSRAVNNAGVSEALDKANALYSRLTGASFELIPSSYKAGTVFAGAPNTGNGDLTWTRASTANRTNSSGFLVSMGSGIPRLSYMYGSCPALLLEPQRTNLYLRSEDFASATWPKSNVSITANNTTSPDGTVDASLFSANGTTSVKSLTQSVSVTSGLLYTISIYAKKNTNDFIQITSTSTFLGTTTFANYDLNNGVLGTVGAGGTATISNVGNGWYRCTLTGTATTTGSQVSGFYIVTSSTSARGESNSLGTSVYIWGSQLEAGAYPTTYIPTTTASATRIGDSFTRNNIYTNGFISAVGGTWFIELRNNIGYVRDATSNYLYIGDSGTSGVTGGVRSFGFRNNASTSVRLSVNYFNGTSSTSLYTTTSDRVKIALKFNGTTMDIFENGVKVVSGASVPITLSTFEFLCGNAQVPQFIQAMALSPTLLSDAQCIALTADITEGESVIGNYERYVNSNGGVVENLSTITNLIQNLK